MSDYSHRSVSIWCHLAQQRSSSHVNKKGTARKRVKHKHTYLDTGVFIPAVFKTHVMKSEVSHFKDLRRHKNRVVSLQHPGSCGSSDSPSVTRVHPVGSHWAATCLQAPTRSRFVRVGEPEVTAPSISLHPSCFYCCAAQWFLYTLT